MSIHCPLLYVQKLNTIGAYTYICLYKLVVAIKYTDVNSAQPAANGPDN